MLQKDPRQYVKVRHTAGVLSLVKLWSRYSQCRKPFPRTCSGTDRVCSLTADGFGQDENDPTRANPKLPLAEEASLTLPRWPALFLFCIYTFSPLLSSLISYLLSLLFTCTYTIISWASKCPRSKSVSPWPLREISRSGKSCILAASPYLHAYQPLFSQTAYLPLEFGKSQKKQLAVHFGVPPRPEI